MTYYAYESLLRYKYVYHPQLHHRPLLSVYPRISNPSQHCCWYQLCQFCTGKSLSEALIFASTNPLYDGRLFIELQVQCMKIPSSNLGRTCCVQKLFPTFRTIFVHNMFSPCSAKRRASDKDLPVQTLLLRSQD